ncbi:MAG: hypothetical protein ACFFDN_00530 [Candidatus Hodarchaeota archaeon]
MKIINAIGGSGSTFVLRELQRLNYPLSCTFIKIVNLEKKPKLIPLYNKICKFFGLYKDKYRVLMRPDSYWTDWNVNGKCTYNPSSYDFFVEILLQKKYILDFWQRRSAYIKIPENILEIYSLHSLVKSYIEFMEKKEKELNKEIFLISGHWGEFGILKDLNIPTIYLIRDPWNSLISHSKLERHQKDYLKRGLKHINQKEWINNFLEGHSHFWINLATSILEHKNAKIVRYNNFVEDWKEIDGLPDITNNFVYKENDVNQILTQESIEYIRNKTSDLCKKLKLPIY